MSKDIIVVVPCLSCAALKAECVDDGWVGRPCVQKSANTLAKCALAEQLSMRVEDLDKNLTIWLPVVMQAMAAQARRIKFLEGLLKCLWTCVWKN